MSFIFLPLIYHPVNFHNGKIHFPRGNVVMEGEGTLITRIPVNEIYRDGNVACTYVDKLFTHIYMGRGPPLRMQKRKNQFHWKRITEEARMPERLRAMKIYYRSGCWPNNNRSLNSGGGGEKKARIFDRIITREEGIPLCGNLSPRNCTRLLKNILWILQILSTTICSSKNSNHRRTRFNPSKLA